MCVAFIIIKLRSVDRFFFLCLIDNKIRQLIVGEVVIRKYNRTEIGKEPGQEDRKKVS